MLGMSASARLPFHPWKKSELSQRKSPRFKGPLVLSDDGGVFLSIKMRCFSIVSSTSNATLQSSEADKTAAKSTLTDRSHSVRMRAASNIAERTRYAVRRKDGRMVLTCSTCEIGIMLQAVRTLKTATAIDRRVLRSFVDAVRARSAI